MKPAANSHGRDAADVLRSSLPASIATIISALLLLLLVNYFSLKHFKTFDLTLTGDFTLSDRTINFISALPESVRITVFGSPPSFAENYLRRLLPLYERASGGKITWAFVDPDAPEDRQAALSLVKEFDLSMPEDLLLISTPQRRTTIRVDDLYQMSPPDFMTGAPRRVTAWLGEEMISSRLLELMTMQKPLAYFLEGHGMGDWRDRESERGWGEAASRIEREYFELRGLSLIVTPEVPDDAALLIIAGPQRPLTTTETESISRYLLRGGRVLVALDWDRESGLEALLAEHGILVRPHKLLGGISQIVGGVEVRQFGSNVPILQKDFPDHPILRTLRLTTILLPNLRALELVAPSRPGWQTLPLLRAPEAFWGESGEWNENTQFDENEDLPGPVTVAAVAEGPARARLAVFGGAFPFDNKNILTQPGAAELWSNTVSWLTARESLMGIGPRQARDFRLRLDTVQMATLFVIVIVLIPGAVLSWGIITWLQRRS